MKELSLELEKIEGGSQEYNEEVKGLKETLRNFGSVFFPATKLHKILEGLTFNGNINNKFKEWKKKVINTVFLCKLEEAIIENKLYKLKDESKEIAYAIYSSVLA